MMRRRWSAALAEHDAVLAAVSATFRAVAPDDWHRPPTPGAWSAATVALHLCQSYEFGVEAVTRGTGMRLRVAPHVARLSRLLLLPALLALRRLPRGARAPREVAPDLDEARTLGLDSALVRLTTGAAAAFAALLEADERRPVPNMTHAYFGELGPYTAMRLLSVHTRHHDRLLRRTLAAA